MPQFDNINLGWALPKRKKHLSELEGQKGNGSKYNHQIKFQSRLVPFPVYVVPLDLPKYRLENGRTQAAQEDYLARHSNLPKEFFRQDKESDQVQRTQHELLYDLLNKNNLFSFFKNPDNKQAEPFILTHDGYVVNGNRRLCAMRTLHAESKEKYSYFESIDIVILPICTPQDIDELEAYLQVQEDIKAEYSWIAEACMLRSRREEHGYDDDALARIYGKSDKEIKGIFQRLGLVDEYLASIGKEKQYDLVEENDYAFKQLHKNRQQIKEDGKKDLFTQISFVLIENSSDVSGRLYDRIPDLKENLNQIADRLPQEINVPKSQKPKSDYSLFGSSSTEMSPLIEAITKPNNKQKVIEAVIDVLDGAREKERQSKRANSVLHEVSEANAHLKNAINYMSDKSVSKTGVKEQIKAIEEAIKQVHAWLKNND